MSIVHLTDQQVRERTVRTDDRADLEDLAKVINARSLCSVAIFEIPGGVRIHVVNGSYQTVFDEEIPLPADSDDPFTIASKRKHIRLTKVELRKFLNGTNPPGAA